MDQIPDLHSPMSPISESPSSPAYSTGKASGGGGAGGENPKGVTLCVYHALSVTTSVTMYAYLYFYFFTESDACKDLPEKPASRTTDVVSMGCHTFFPKHRLANWS